MTIVLKKRLRILLALWLFGYLFMIVSCGDFNGAFATPIINELSEIATPMNEFSAHNTPMHKKSAHEGVYLGDVTMRGAQWRRYHFPNVLEPPDRTLEILVVNAGSNKVILREVDNPGDGHEPALLFDQCFCGDCVEKVDPQPHHLYTNALGSEDYISPPSTHLGGNHYSGGFATAEISLRWVQRSRADYIFVLAKMLYAVPLDIIILPAQPVLLGLQGV